MDDPTLLHVADRNLEEFAREHARWLPPWAIDERDYAVFVASGTRFPAGAPNCVLPRAEPGFDPGRLLDEARAFFGARGRGFSVYAPAHLGPELARACEAAKLVQLGGGPGLALTETLERLEPPAGVRVEVVETAEQAQHFVDVAASGFEALGMPAAVTRKLFSQTERWRRSYIHIELVYEHDRPVACAMLLFSHGIAGVYWVSTIADARGRGHGSLVTRSVSRHAFARGAGCVVLQASPFGEPVYRKLGYREFTRYPWYLAPAP